MPSLVPGPPGRLAIIREVYQNGWVATTLAGLGALGSILAVASLIAPELPSYIPKYGWAVLVIALVTGSFILRIPHTRSAYSFRGGPWSIEIKVGDLFDEDSNIVVTADRSLTTSIRDIGTDSLVGQLITRWYESESVDLSSSLDLTKPKPDDQDFELGTMIRFHSPSGKNGWLFCLATKTERGSRTTWQELALAYDSLWSAIRRENLARITVPVIGAGFARTQLPFNGLLLFLILSFHAAGLERPITKCLRIMITPGEFDPRLFVEAARILSYLGYDRA